MFSLEKSSKIIIYGAATSGRIIYGILKKNGFNIIAFIDKRADELGELDGKRIVGSIDDISDNDIEKCVVIIAIKNVFEHTKIATKLVKSGISNILYKPYSVLNGEGTEDEKKISEYYDDLLANRLDIISCIPQTKGIIGCLCKDFAFIREEDDCVWARVPVCLIYANKNKTIEKKSIWGDIPILSMFPHIGLFQEFLCEHVQNGIEDYVVFCCEAAKNAGSVEITERWKQNVVSNRLDVFHNMESAYELDNDFFVRNAPLAEWNDNGYFNLLGGKHRCTFLVAKGNQYITLKMSKKDYDEWIHYDKISGLGEVLDQSVQEYSKAGVIEHPYFYKYPLEGKTFICKMWVKICGMLSHDIYEKWNDFAFDKMTALVSVDDLGYIARNLSRMGVKVFRKTKNIELEQKIDEVVCVTTGKYWKEDGMPEVDLAVVENRVYEKARLCFVVASADKKAEIEERGGKLIMSGGGESGKRFLFLM